jgi:hypothetical protein
MSEALAQLQGTIERLREEHRTLLRQSERRRPAIGGLGLGLR